MAADLVRVKGSISRYGVNKTKRVSCRVLLYLFVCLSVFAGDIDVTDYIIPPDRQ